MSLVGSLDDLALGDLLQILCLSSKSGLLTLQAAEGAGWILFESGQVAGACRKGDPPDLPALLRAHGHEAASSLALPALEALRRRAAEDAVMGMLGWIRGEFRFDGQDAEARVEPSGLRLATPIPSQYLALEGVRVADERPVDPHPAAPPPHVRAATAERLPHPLVVIDPALGALEWLKASLSSSFVHVHIFQSTELGVTRIRQYLARGEWPVVLLARDARPDPLSGIRDASELVLRLEQLAPRMPIVLLVERAGPSTPLLGPATPGVRGVLARPSVERLRDPRNRQELLAEAEALRGALVATVTETGPATAA